MKLRKGDNVHIISGKDRGKEGSVVRVYADRGRVTVQGINMYTKHVKPKKQGETGQSIRVPRPLALSNVMVVCPTCKKPARIGYRVDGKTKTRFCKRCNATF